jgi:RNA polymerase sigma-B factor
MRRPVVDSSSEPWLEPDFERLPRAERSRVLLEAAARTSEPSDRAALEERAIATNMKVAAELAARYRQRGVADEDLEQVAYLALVKAVRRYKYAPDRDFLSFAVPTIRGELRRYFRDFGWSIRPTRRIQDAQRAITEAEGGLLQQLGRAPRPSEIAAHLGLDLDLVIEALSVNGYFHTDSLEALRATDDGGVHDRIGQDDPGFTGIEQLALLKPLLASINSRERIMLEMRFFQDATQVEIGKKLGINQTQVSRLLSALMARLRDQLAEPVDVSHDGRDGAAA